MRFNNTLTNLLRPHEPIPTRVYLTAATLTIGLILILWSALTYGGFVRSLFLPSPTAMLLTAGEMMADGSLVRHSWASIYVIFIGWFWASALAVPLGILMGSFGFVAALIEPVVNFIRYLPVSALLPLLILYVGIGVEQKIAVIFIGTFFQLILLVADTAGNVSKELIDCAYTLGVKRLQIVHRVLIPATLPGVMDHLRITIGWAWTYLVVAELVASDKGLGYMILNAQRGLRTDRIFVGLLVIGGLGFVTDYSFKWLYRQLLPWSTKVG